MAQTKTRKLVKKPVKKKPAKKVVAKSNKATGKTKSSVAKSSVAKSSVEGIRHWLFKSEPDAWSWEQQKARGKKGEEWDGIRNYQARNNMRAMQIGDLGFFYHSNEGLEVVGIIEVCKLVHPDTTTDDERWECVDVRAICDMPKPVKLAHVKAAPKLTEMSLVTSMRLSVQPVTSREWKIVCEMGGIDPKKIRD